MATERGNDVVFPIGLVLSGTVSAGAYSAGVIDFLNESLETYYHQREKEGWSGPRHRPVIKVMSGTSGGAVVAATYLLSLSNTTATNGARIPAVRPYDPASIARSANENWLYRLWVKELDLQKFLDTSDIKPKEGLRGVGSFLNSEPLSNLVMQIIAWAGQGSTQRQPTAVPYVATDVELFITTTNLNGVPYEIKSGSLTTSDDENIYYLREHSNHQRFLVENLGAAHIPAPGGPAVVVPAEVPYPAQKIDAGKTASWSSITDAALASSAVPTAFEPRALSRRRADFTRPFVRLDEGSGHNETYERKVDPILDERFLNVDGGVFDNEPLSYAIRTLWGEAAGELWADSERKVPASAERLDRAVILIDPFRNSFGAGMSVTSDLVGMITALGNALINQGSFRLPLLQGVHKPHMFTRFNVVPDREVPENSADPNRMRRNGAFSATAGLFGFRGFLSERLRRHDYQLGRRNCQRFLAKHFVLPEDNPIVREFHDRDDNRSRRSQYGWYSKKVNKWFYRIIPLVGALNPDLHPDNAEKKPDWPELDPKSLEELRPLFHERFLKIAEVFTHTLLDDVPDVTEHIPTLLKALFFVPAMAFDVLTKLPVIKKTLLKIVQDVTSDTIAHRGADFVMMVFEKSLREDGLLRSGPRRPQAKGGSLPRGERG